MRRKPVSIAATVCIIHIFSAVFFLNTALAAEDTVEERLHSISLEMLKDGNYEQASGKLEAMFSEHPEAPRIHVNLAVANYGLMRYENAYEILKKAPGLQKSGETAKLRRYIMTSIEKDRALLEEIERLNKAFSRTSGQEERSIKDAMAQAHIAQVSSLLKRKYYYPSLAACHLIWLKKNVPEYSEIYAFSGDMYYSAMLYRNAQADYKTAIETAPDDTYLHRKLADCLVATGDYDEAGDHYLKCIELYAARKPVNKKEISRIKRIIEALPRRYSDIDRHMEAKRYSEAERICRERVSLNPGDYVAIAQLGNIFWHTDRRGRATKLFEDVVKKVPDYPVGRFFLGRSYFYEHKHKRALKEFAAFKKKIELLPEMTEDSLEFYISVLHNICYLYTSLKRYGLILKECKEIIKLKPDDQDAYYNMAVCYYKLHKPSQARNLLGKVIDLDDSSRAADRAKTFIDYINSRPDPRFDPDFLFVQTE